MIKIGKFYHIYGKDAYIISYIFNYKITETDGVKICGFPENSIKRVCAKLEENKINYIIVDRRNNYEVDEISNNKNLNTYNKYFNKSKKYINEKIRIDNIYNYLLENIDKSNFLSIVKKVEEIIYERREI